VIWSALFISLAAYSAQKAVEADPEIEEKLSQHFSEKWGTTINVSLDADSSDQNSDQKKDEWIIKNSITNIQIETINGDIEIVTVPDKNNIQISARGKLNKKKAPRLLEVLESEKELSITQPDQSAVKSLQLKIEIPESYSGELIVNTVTGDFSANNFKPENIKLNSISGDISFVDITSNQVQLKSVSGDINLDNVLAKELESITTSGDVSIHFPGLQNDIKFDIQTVSGDIDNQNKSAGQGIRRYKVNTVSGDVEIR
ncbi:MAG: DUF4097 family beta strand repeat-containing protein, partial [Bdellovibrionales bacterium]